jgi:hypothetical protein
MKHFRPIPITTILAALLISGAVMFNACSKQESTVNPASEQQLSPQDLRINNTIKNFRDKMAYQREHPGYKSGETMSVDSAQWYLDAVFNYSYAYTEESFETFNSGTFLITLEKNGQQIDFENVCQAFDELKQQTLLIYYNTEGNQKELYVSNMAIAEETEASVVIEVTATIGSRTNETPPEFSQWGPFVAGDNWMYGEKLGDCSPGGGIWWGIKDAATEICWATNHYRYKYIQDEGAGWYAYYTGPSALVEATVYYSLQNQILFRNPNDPTIDNNRDYLIHYQKKDVENGLEIETCISWEDMNFYYHGTHKVIYDIIQDNYDAFGVPDCLTFYSCQMQGIGEGNDIYDPTYVHHKVSPLYKTRYVCYIDERTSLGDE